MKAIISECLLVFASDGHYSVSIITLARCVYLFNRCARCSVYRHRRAGCICNRYICCFCRSDVLDKQIRSVHETSERKLLNTFRFGTIYQCCFSPAIGDRKNCSITTIFMLGKWHSLQASIFSPASTLCLSRILSPDIQIGALAH